MKIISFVLMLLLTSSGAAESIAIKNPVPEIKYSLTRAEVVWMYTMKTRFWDDGTKITVFYLDRDSKIHKDFCENVLKIKPEKFDMLLNTRLNAGNAGSFRLVKKQSDVAYQVSLIDGAIGYYDDKTMFVNEGDGYVKTFTIID